jgi:DNA-damage-inducible protein J
LRYAKYHNHNKRPVRPGHKKDFETFCGNVGLNPSTAITLFVKTVLKEKRIPFEISEASDPFYSEANMKFLRESIAQLERGEGILINDVDKFIAERG